MSEMNTTVVQVLGRLLVIQIAEQEYLRCLCAHCGVPGEVPSTKARCSLCGTYYFWPTEPEPMTETPRGASPGTISEVVESSESTALVPPYKRAGRTQAQPAVEPKEPSKEKSATAVEVPEHASFVPIPTGCIAEDSGDSRAEEPILISSEEEVGDPSVAMRLPANHPSGIKEEQLSADPVRPSVGAAEGPKQSHGHGDSQCGGDGDRCDPRGA
ncbi:uncharacterized protein LOC142487914 [Ascaphus truei]|uniref:uncharacterized protein LOC142487914 n=1 Tax=Ascaphus truei TaxID=8439 RepID=UPI003F59BCFC